MYDDNALDSISLLDVFDKCGITGYNLTSSGEVIFPRRRCPFCGKDNAFTANYKKGVFNCFKSSCGKKGGKLDFYAEYMGVSKSEAFSVLVGRDLKDETSAEKAERLRQKAIANRKLQEQAAAQDERRSPSERNKTYTKLLSLLPIAEDHIEEMIRRTGFTRNEVLSSPIFNLYRTNSGNIDPKLIEMIQEAALYVDHIPGFFKENGSWHIVKTKRGIMIPVRDHFNNVVGFQIRKDNNLLKEGEQKFSWFSSAERDEGTSAKADLHYAVDWRDGKPFLPDGAIFFTEGVMKADISHSLSGKPFLACPGVYVLNELASELKWLEDNCGLKKVYICFDMDYQTNVDVYAALDKAISIIQDKGLKVDELVWNDSYKGIDDYLLAKKKGLI